MKEFRISRPYDIPVADLLALWRDPAFLRALSERYGGIGEPRIGERGDEVVVETRRQLPLDQIPGPLQRFAGKGELVQTDVWPRTPAATGAVEGRWSVDGGGMPAEMSGRHVIRPQGGGCVCEANGAVKVRLPLVAGKVEALIVDNISTLLRKQQEFAARWLSGAGTG